MKGESSYYAYTVGYSSYGESFSDTAVSLGDYDAFESLYSLFGTFDNLERNLNGVAYVERRNAALQVFFFDLFDNIHDLNLRITTRSRPFFRRRTARSLLYSIIQ